MQTQQQCLLFMVMSEIASGGELSYPFRPGRKALQPYEQVLGMWFQFCEKKKIDSHKWIQEEKPKLMQFLTRSQTRQRELVLSTPLAVSTHVFVMTRAHYIVQNR